MGGETRHVINQIGPDALSPQYPHIVGGEMEMTSEGVEVVNDCASLYPVDQRSAALHFCVQSAWYTRLPES